ncbi:ATP-dependent Clp protease proteolytic subunit [Thermoleptolyngbya sp. M55_K2018_002]|jgi:ClpP class serine protease|uniref:SDH family Clp fold serine proteinase n=1 Tax=Thermoleptolyngbya sp. M55_K2018_002 TaxID=2747808 RepID=UPI001A0ED689|nr:ATP-dependent Clp protease proteolytic subunit [Thermoleptolyngbya sp. M55_K2018_002]HIK40568.1 ATP-dependent Clp protease proteolytic subunit [Thermoleptolyngbya sp. M55_K2018_002]
MSLVNLLIVFFLISSISPLIQRFSTERRRLMTIQAFERSRGSRVILLIHRQESISFLGVPVSRFISIEDSEQVLRAIRLTPPNVPIDLILHTPGGLVLATEQIARALVRHPAKVTVFVPHYAMSGGTMLAMAADEIVMDENAVLGPVDPQLGSTPAASVLKVLEDKPISDIDDQTIVTADIARKAIRQVQKFVRTLLEDCVPKRKIEPERIDRIIEALTTGQVTHDYPISVEEAQELGLHVVAGLPKIIYNLMDLYPQPSMGRPTVQYIPLPYENRPMLPESIKE